MYKKINMKVKISTIVWTIILSTVLWLGYYISASGIAPSSEETTVLVGISIGIVLTMRWLWKQILKGKKNEKETDSD